MEFMITAILSFTALAIAKPVLNIKSNGAAIPLTRHSPGSPNARNCVDLDAVHFHVELMRHKILDGIGNYERNTGRTHPFAVRGSESRKRGAGLPLTAQASELWYAELSIGIGSSAETFNVSIDTGSPDMFIPKIGCSTCEGHKMWDPRLSTTSKPVGKPFNIKYSDGDIVSGDQYTDYVTIAGLTVYPQTFGAATQYSPGLKKELFVPDGFLGMSFPTLSRYRADPLFTTLVKSGKVINPTVSFKLTASGGEMYIGGANSSLYNGNIVYTRVTEPLAYWQVPVEEIRVGDKSLRNIQVVIDTGANYIVGDPARVAALYEGTGARSIKYLDSTYYIFPCKKFPRVALTFSGTVFEVDSELLNIGSFDERNVECYSGLIAADFSVRYWNIGAVFLRGVYTVFDYSTLQVGFARLA